MQSFIYVWKRPSLLLYCIIQQMLDGILYSHGLRKKEFETLNSAKLNDDVNRGLVSYLTSWLSFLLAEGFFHG